MIPEPQGSRPLVALLLRGGEPPRTAAAWVLAAAVLLAFMATALPLVRLLDRAVIGSSSGIYLEFAVNDAWCGRYPYLTTGPGTPPALDLTNFQLAAVGETAIRRLVADRVGSVDAYCSSPARPSVMNEMSFTALESLILRVNPDITFAGLGRALAWLRFAMLAAFGLCLVRCGYSLVLAGSVTAAALYLTVLIGGNALYSQYPLLMPVTMFGIGAAAAFLACEWHHHGGRWVMMSAAAGAWCGFVGNLRTSLYPEAAMVGVLFLWFVHRDRRLAASATAGRRPWLLLACGAWLFGLLAFDAAYVRPVRGLSSDVNSSAHGIAHPLVLGLALPPNPLAAREGIEWNDDVGRVLAQRVDPGVAYLGPDYERTLFAYYRQLWVRYPGEMAGLYLTKLAATSRSTYELLASTAPSIFWSEKDGRWLRLAVWPLAAVAVVVPLPLLFVALAASGWIGWRRRSPARVFLVTTVGVVGLLAFLEAAIVLGSVVLWYCGVLLICTVFVGCLAYQWVLERSWHRLATVAPIVVRNLLVRADRPGWHRVGMQSVLTAVAIVGLAPGWAGPQSAPRMDAAGLAHLGSAIGLAWCGSGSGLGPSSEVLAASVGDRESRITPIRSLILTQFGSMSAFCAAAAAPRSTDHFALVAWESGLLRMRPAISIAGVEKALHYARLLLLFAVVAGLAAIGYSAVVAAGAGLAGLWSLAVVGEQQPADLAGPLLLVWSAVWLAWCARRRGVPLPLAGWRFAFAATVWSVVVIALCPGLLVPQAAVLATLLWMERTPFGGHDHRLPRLLLAAAIASGAGLAGGLILPESGRPLIALNVLLVMLFGADRILQATRVPHLQV